MLVYIIFKTCIALLEHHSRDFEKKSIQTFNRASHESSPKTRSVLNPGLARSNSEATPPDRIPFLTTLMLQSLLLLPAFLLQPEEATQYISNISKSQQESLNHTTHSPSSMLCHLCIIAKFAACPFHQSQMEG